MKWLAFLTVLALLASPALGLSNSASNYNAVSDRIDAVETVYNNYQTLVLNLNSQGAMVSKPIGMLSKVNDLITESKTYLSENNVDAASKAIEDAVAILPQITLDTRSSYEVNKGSLALEESLSLITSARSQGYNTTGLEELYYNASSLLSDAKQSYMQGDYGSVDPKISTVLSMSDRISSDFGALKNRAVSQAVANNAPAATGFAIMSYSWVAYPIILIAASSFIILKVARRKKELRGIEKLVRIKCRME